MTILTPPTKSVTVPRVSATLIHYVAVSVPLVLVNPFDVYASVDIDGSRLYDRLSLF